MTLWAWQSMVEVLPEGTCGYASIKHVRVTPEDSARTMVRALVTRGREGYVPEGRYAQLFVKQTLMMSDTPGERDSNDELLRNARGDILIAGLGMGTVLFPIFALPHVRTVTVVEKHTDVIQLIETPLREKLQVGERLLIQQGDIFDWTPPRGARYDAIYFDIWPDICSSNLREMKQLHQKFRRRRRNGWSWMESWSRDYLA